MGEQVSHPEWRDEVLERLDAAAELNMFPGQPNEHLAIADMRMKSFRSHEEWLLVVEVIAWSIRDATFENQVSVFSRQSEYPELKVFEVVKGPGGARLWDEDDTFALDLADLHVEVRGKPRSWRPTAEDLATARVDDDSMPAPARVIRLVASEAGEDLFLTDQELLDAAGRGDSDAELFVRSDGWRQPDIYASERPSEMDCFRSLANALAEGDRSLFACPESDWNTHWSNWEE